MSQSGPSASSTSSQQQQQQPLQASRLATGVVPDQPTPSSASSSSSSASALAPAAISSSAHRLAEGRMPCARRSYLLGLGTGIGVTAIRMVTGRGLRTSANWGAGAFVLVSVTSWEMCRRSLAAEQNRMKMVIQHHQRNRGSKALATPESAPLPPSSSPASTSASTSSPPPSRIASAQTERI